MFLHRRIYTQRKKVLVMNKIYRFMATGVLLLLLFSGCTTTASPSAPESSSSGSPSIESSSEPEASSLPEASSQDEASSKTSSSSPETASPQTQTFTVQVVNEEGEPEPNLDVDIWYFAPTPKQPDLYEPFAFDITNQQGLTRQFTDVPPLASFWRSTTTRSVLEETQKVSKIIPLRWRRCRPRTA